MKVESVTFHMAANTSALAAAFDTERWAVSAKQIQALRTLTSKPQTDYGAPEGVCSRCARALPLYQLGTEDEYAEETEDPPVWICARCDMDKRLGGEGF